MRKQVALRAALLMLLAVSAAAQISAVPTQMSFQGRLAKPDGTPVPDSNSQALTFRLYSVVSGGTLLWSQNNSVAVHNGAFAVPLDFSAGFAAGQSLTTVFAPLTPVYLEIQVGSAAPLAPRQSLKTSPYAFLANTVPDGSLTTAKFASGVLNFGNISGQITSAQIGAGVISPSNFNSVLQSSLNHFTTGFALVSNVPTPAFTEALAVTPNYLYAATYASPGLFQIYAIGGVNATSPALTGSVAVDNTPAAIAISGNYAYLACGGSNTLEAINISSPAAPAFAGRAATGNVPANVVVAKGYAYVVNLDDNTLQAFSLSSPAAPAFASTVTTYVTPSGPFVSGGGAPIGLAASGNYLYVTNNVGNTLQIFNITNPALPSSVAVIGTANEPVSVAVSGIYAYVTTIQSGALQTYNVANPAAPVLVSTVTAPTGPVKVVISGGLAFVIGSASNNLSVFSLANPAAPVLTASLGTGSYPQGLGVNGSLIYEVNGAGNTLQTYDLNGLLINTGIQAAGNLSVANEIIVDANGQNSGSLASSLRFGGAGNGEGIFSQRLGSGNVDGLDFATASVSRLSIANNGNIGVGTSSPQNKLDVRDGGISLTNTADNKNYALNYDSTGHYFYIDEFGTARRFVIKNGGFVGINNIAPAYALDVTGDINASGNVRVGGVIKIASDARYKKNIAALENPLENLLALRGVSYDWDREKWPAKNFADTRQIGFIAQDLEKIFPELVFTDKEGYKSVNYVGVVPILVEAVKAQQKQIDALKADNAELRKQSARISELEKNLTDVLAALKASGIRH